MVFEERNVRGDYAALRELVEDYQSQQTPTLVIGTRVIIGFNADEYDKALRAVTD